MSSFRNAGKRLKVSNNVRSVTVNDRLLEPFAFKSRL